jgi:hypothetical protein
MRAKNFLLACKSCNSIKNVKQNSGKPNRPTAALAQYLWPDTDNTARAFVYHHSNSITVAPGLPADITNAAVQTVQMTGIDRTPATTPKATPQDKRWRKRQEAWNKAQAAQKDVLSCNTPEMRRTVGSLAAATGFWSIWRVVFDYDPVMLAIINDAFVGTAHDCFDPATRQPVARPGGRI